MSKNNRLTKAEKQQVFNLVASRLVKQGRQSVTSVPTPSGPSKFCVYRKKMRTGPDLKCAIGQLIPKKAYRPEFDGHTVGNGFDHIGMGYYITRLVFSLDRDKLSPLSRKALSKPNHQFLRALQCWHDGIDPTSFGDVFRKKLASASARIVKDFNLELPASLKAYLLWVLVLLES